jgi:predicted signal transduction protein with EAL and GGDEF domain
VVRGTNPPDDTETDTVARLGGDEFIVLLTDVELPEDVAHVARRITDLMSHPITVDGHEISVGASLGIAMQPADGDDAEILLRKADAAMYAAKTAGRNSFRFYTDDLYRGVDNRLWLENEMEKALDQRAFAVFFQPEIDAKSGTVVGAEALLRWHHPERGFISPAEFIPVAEETGLIGPLGTYALQEACRYAVTAVRRIPTFQRIAVNVSAKQLRDERFVDIVQQALHAAGLDARHLELEITESAFVEQGKVDANLSHLREIGISIALDDFGTGYSSLAHLARWPIDTVKIDRSFVVDLPNNPKSLGMVRGIMALAKCFAGRVVAEGIEEPRQRDMLLEEGCKVMQGYMYCKPLPFDEFLKWSITAMAPRSMRPSHSSIAQLQIVQGAAE